MQQFPAHIRIDPSGREYVQTVEAHNRAVSLYAASILHAIGLESAGALCGLLHDMGKFTACFRDYISRAARKEPVRKGEVNHTFAAVRFLFERYYQETGAPMRNMTCEILAYAAGAHHSQFDCIAPDGRDGFTHRLTKEDVAYEEARENFRERFALAELDALFDKAVSEITQGVSLCQGISKTQGDVLFYLSLLCRMLLSAVIDGDRRDTAEFTFDTRIQTQAADMRPVWSARLAAVEQKLDALPLKYPVDEARKRISALCGQPTEARAGVCRLSVPTGSGKTLASLRFALAAAAAHNKQRIIFTSPLLSILDQNVKVIRAYINADELLLEHHSNVVRTEEKYNELDENELLLETWDAPIVVTTFVQMLNTLFDGKTGSIRRMSALIDSVIIIDEIQSLPNHMISQFNLAINFLTTVCHATVLLCSATQPCLEDVAHPMSQKPPELVPYDAAVWELFRRTKIIDKRVTGGYTAEELAGFALDLLPNRKSVLLICNKKEQAHQLYQLLKHAPARVFHLSTSMCMAHRRATLDEINQCLGHEPVICVTTQLIESGVDLSFGCVIRVIAGMDNLIQAAGRCNRNREDTELAPVYIVNFRNEDLSRLTDIRKSQIATEELLASFMRDADQFADDLESEAAIRFFYKRLFGNMKQGEQDYPVAEHHTTLYNMLSLNRDFRAHCPTPAKRVIGQAFKTAGQVFQVFDDNTEDILVPYGEGAEIIKNLCSSQAMYDLNYRLKELKKTKGYTISLFAYQIKQLESSGGLHLLCDGTVKALQPGFYSDEVGLTLTGNPIFPNGGII